ncbi:hypothetical protein JBE38_13845 [Pseudomonas sp. ICBG1301]|uniref:hypothetical protein n=1 Tax=Pseudomonas sp. ICBG1301 TaxID=2795987 RepID=UPI00196322AC|nr:hypothetical protein [Pseudomonas sp. ICBG1301]MBM9487009.1 hypothetical protein [Pseudomonas sp. ICBG1301]
MTHPKNSITQQTLQLPKLTPFSFGDAGCEMFTIKEGADLIEGLKIAADISDGINQLCGRLYARINDGEIAYVSEVRALGFLGEVVCALARSAQVSLQKQQDAGGDQ